MHNKISLQVRNDIALFILQNIQGWKEDVVIYVQDEEDFYLPITFAIDDDGTQWNFQTGDNSFMGNCYSLPHWAIEGIDEDTDPLELHDSVMEQLEECLIYSTTI